MMNRKPVALWHLAKTTAGIDVEEVSRSGRGLSTRMHVSSRYPSDTFVMFDDDELNCVVAAPAMHVLLKAVNSHCAATYDTVDGKMVRYHPIGRDDSLVVPLYGDLNESARALIEYDPSLAQPCR